MSTPNVEGAWWVRKKDVPIEEEWYCSACGGSDISPSLICRACNSYEGVIRKPVEEGEAETDYLIY